MKFIISFIIILGAFISIFHHCNRVNQSKLPIQEKPEINSKQNIEKEISKIRSFLDKNQQYNSEIAFLIDMKMKSGQNRFFVYDFKTKKVVDQGLVAHGSGSESGVEGKLIFSNIENSLSTSLGKYSIGNSYYGNFGKAYKLIGLDSTNSNAYLRNIVLHYYKDVPYDEQEIDICHIYGCPMVNQKFFSRLENMIDKSEKKIIISIFY